MTLVEALEHQVQKYRIQYGQTEDPEKRKALTRQANYLISLCESRKQKNEIQKEKERLSDLHD